jgi:hypothetical protein
MRRFSSSGSPSEGLHFGFKEDSQETVDKWGGKVPGRGLRITFGPGLTDWGAMPSTLEILKGTKSKSGPSDKVQGLSCQQTQPRGPLETRLENRGSEHWSASS